MTLNYDLRARTATSQVSLSPGSSWGYLWAPLPTGLPSALPKGDGEACPCITAKGRECPARGRRQQRHGVRWADCPEACPHPACNLPGTPGCSAFLQASGSQHGWQQNRLGECSRPACLPCPLSDFFPPPHPPCMPGHSQCCSPLTVLLRASQPLPGTGTVWGTLNLKVDSDLMGRSAS